MQNASATVQKPSINNIFSVNLRFLVNVIFCNDFHIRSNNSQLLQFLIVHFLQLMNRYYNANILCESYSRIPENKPIKQLKKKMYLSVIRDGDVEEKAWRQHDFKTENSIVNWVYDFYAIRGINISLLGERCSFLCKPQIGCTIRGHSSCFRFIMCCSGK